MRHSQSKVNETRPPVDEPVEQGSASIQIPGDAATSEFHLWKVLFEQTPEAVAVLSKDDRVLRINKEFTRMFGYEPDEVLHRPVNDLIVPAALAESAGAYTRLLEKGGRVEVETVRRRKDGSEIAVSLLAVPVTPPSGERLVNYAIYRDITERKRAEELLRESEARFQAMADKAPVMIWTTGTDGLCNYFSKPWLDFTGRAMEQEVGTGWLQGVHPDDVQLCFDGFLPAFHARKPFTMEYRLRRADGEYRWVIESGVPRYTVGGEFAGYIGSNIDITDRKRAESLLAGEKRILEMVAKGDSLAEILDSLCRLVEEQASGVVASILLLDRDRLRHGGAPSLPKAYTDAIDGAVIGPSAGPCGTAAYRGKQVIAEDIATDPLWADYRDLALPHSLRACWSTPVFSSQGKLIATFAMYYREPRRPSTREQEIIEQITHLAGVAIERKLTQEALRHSEAYLAEAQKLTHTGNWVWDVRTREATYLSDEWFRIYGLDPASNGRAWEQRLQIIHPEDRSKWEAAVDRAISEKSDYEFEYRLVFPDGTTKYIHVVGHPIVSASGEVVQFMGSVTDITERKQAEQALRRSEAYLAEAQRLTHTGSWAWNVRTSELFWSQEVFRIYEIEPETKATWSRASWSRFLDRVHPEDRVRIEQQAKMESTEKHWAVSEIEFRVVVSDGTIKHVHAISYRVADDSGDTAEVMGTIMDVTERRRAETERERLRQLEANLAHISRVSMMGELAASLAHEIKQPISAALTNAKTCIRWLKRDNPDLAEACEAASRMVNDTTRAADIIDRVRSLYRRDTSKRELLDLNEIIREMIVLLYDKASRSSISIRSELDPGLPPITADRVQLQQVLVNLMLNGIEAMKDASGELTITSKRTEDGQVLVSVIDSGIGIAPDQANKIFEAFFSTKPQGTGMGLSISRRIIESHGGRIWADANSGRGTIFHFILPTDMTESSSSAA
jgi:PAS domain S-box-containing protein